MKNKTKRRAKVVSDKQLAGLRQSNDLRSERAHIGRELQEKIRELYDLCGEAYLFGIQVGLSGYNAQLKKVRDKNGKLRVV
jgi:hypothetical protein